MSVDIIIRFPSKEIADIFCGQMSDGVGEGFCDFNYRAQVRGTDGTKREHFENVFEGDIPVFFVNEVFCFD